MTPGMAATVRKQYDHRIRQAIVKTGDPDLFPKLAIPDSTRRTWLTRGAAEVVTLDDRDTRDRRAPCDGREAREEGRDPHRGRPPARDAGPRGGDHAP